MRSERARADTAATPFKGDPVRSLIAGIDAYLRRRQGYVEFTDDPACILRVTLTTARTELRLADGTAVAPGATILELHFWNERMPQAAEHHGLAWGGRFVRQMRLSLRELARAVGRDPRLAAAVAIRGRLAFAEVRDREGSRRFGGRFGMELPDDMGARTLKQRLYEAAEDFWLVALTYTYNPGCLGSRSLVRRRDDLWMSCEALTARYGPSAIAARAAD